jgi:TRAP-type C4-dicarboxylate transport system permease small subunit
VFVGVLVTLAHEAKGECARIFAHVGALLCCILQIWVKGYLMQPVVQVMEGISAVKLPPIMS